MTKISYGGYRFPPEIIQQAIWLYLRFTLSLRDVEDLLAGRGITVSYESIRRWVIYFGPMIAADLRKRRPKPHTSWHLDEVYLKIDGRMAYLWRAVDAEGECAGPVETGQACRAEAHAQAAQEIRFRSRSIDH
jgi:putative transposase